MIVEGIMRVSSTVVEASRVAGRVDGEVAAVDEQPVVGPSYLRWMCVERRIIRGRIEAAGAERISVKMWRSPALPHVLVAVVDLALLWRPTRIVIPYCGQIDSS